MDKIYQKISATHIAHSGEICSLAPEWESKPSRGQDLSPRPCRESGFAYGRSEASPDSEQIEHVIAEQFMRNSVSVEQIQDRCVRRTGEGSHFDKIAQQMRDDSVSSLAPRRESKPSRGMSEAKGEQESASATHVAHCDNIGSYLIRWFGDDCERCRLTRGAVDIFKTKAAFTLAEVLITLGIIGVVAAMTLPSLIQNYQKKALATQTQKFYSTMSQAVKQYMADYGVDDLRNTPLASDNYEDIESSEAIASIRDFATKYLKVVKECNPNDEDDNSCFVPEYRRWDNALGGESFGSFPNTYVLADGSTIYLSYLGNKSSPAPIGLYVDVNGKKGPNRNGYDLWSMSIYYDGVIDDNGVGPECRGRIDPKYNNDNLKCEQTSAQEKRERRFEEICKTYIYATCFGHFLNNNFKFDY